MISNRFQFQDKEGIPAHHGRRITWTSHTTGVLNSMNPHRTGEWSFWDRGFQGALSHGLGISGKTYTVGVNTDGKYVLLCDGSPVKLLRFNGSWGVISNIGRQVMLRLDQSQYFVSVYPIELLDGEYTFMSASQIDYANRFPELIVVKDGKRRVHLILGGENELDGTEKPTIAELESGKQVQLNGLDQLSISGKATLTPQ